MTITDERKKNLDFSDPYFDATQALLAKKGSGITSMDTTKGHKVGSQASTTGEDYVKAHGADPVSFETSEAELNGLRSGQVEVIVQDLPVVNGWLKDSANSDFEIVANLDTGEQYGFAVKKDGNDECWPRSTPRWPRPAPTAPTTGSTASGSVTSRLADAPGGPPACAGPG